MNVTENPLGEPDLHGGSALAQGVGGLPGAAKQARLGGIHRGGHYTAQSLEYPHCGAVDHGVVDGIHLAVHHVDGVIQGVLGKDFCIVRPGGNGCFQHAAANIY